MFNKKEPKVRINEVYRDAIQSLMGTNPSAEEIVAAHQNAHLIGTATIQTTGGTFFDMPAQKGRDEWAFNDVITGHFKEKGVVQTALIRNDCLFGYAPQPFDVVKATVLEFAKMGVNIFQNFHGLNYVPAMEGVAEAVRQVRKETGLDVRVAGTVCIEDNVNVTVDSCLRTIEQLVKTHDRIYFKSASGVTSHDFNNALGIAFAKNFAGVDVDWHGHGTYGLAADSGMAFIQGAVENGVSVGIDCQHPAMAGSTAHLNMLKMVSLMRHHPSQTVRDAAPVLNLDAIHADMKSLVALRYRYRSTEARYNRELLEGMLDARAPGGASATLRGIPQLEANLAAKLGTKNWDEIQKAIYKKQAEILPLLGDPTQVTPYAKETTIHAAYALLGIPSLYPSVAYYLVGGLGPVPESTDPALVKKALRQLDMACPYDYVPSQERDDALPAAKQALQDAGVAEPTLRQQVSAVSIKDGVKHVVEVAKGKNKPQAKPELEEWARPALPIKLKESWRGERPGIKETDQTRRMRKFIDELGGIEEVYAMVLRADHVMRLKDGWEVFPEGTEGRREVWIEKNVAALNTFMKEKVPTAISASVLSVMTTSRHEQQAEELLRSIFDERADKLYELVKKVVRDYGRTSYAAALSKDGENVAHADL